MPANNDALVAVVDLAGVLDFTLTRPEFEQYLAAEAPFAPTDTTLAGERLFVTADLQYIKPASGSFKNALVPALRTQIRF